MGFRTAVVSSRRLTSTTHAVQVEKPKSFIFRPTQFTFLQLLTDAGMGRASDVARDKPDATAPGVRGPPVPLPIQARLRRLRPGDEVVLFGPFGDFMLHETRPAILVAGGIGVTPLKGMAEYASDRALPIPIRLVHSNRSEDDIKVEAFRGYTWDRADDDGSD